MPHNYKKQSEIFCMTAIVTGTDVLNVKRFYSGCYN